MLTEQQIMAVASAHSELKAVHSNFINDTSDDTDVDAVQQAIAELEAAFPEIVNGDLDEALDASMDGDLESGLASAGFGTDEDYKANETL